MTHSAGGLYTRTFQKLYPQEVVGLVLVDSHSEDLFLPLPEVFTSSLPMFQLCQKVLTPLSIVRLSGLLPQVNEIAKLPADLQAPALARLNRPDFCATAYAETVALEESARQLKGAPGSLGDLPLAVIQAGLRAADDWPDAETWADTQQKLASLSTRSKLFLAEKSGHYVHLDQPEIVLQAVEWVLGELENSH